MNDDDFEQTLQALTGALHRPDPTPPWKADILARARLEADAAPFKRTLPPRWLMLSWAAAWVAIALMHFATPRNVNQGVTSNYAASRADQKHKPATASDTTYGRLMALQRHYNFTNDFP